MSTADLQRLEALLKQSPHGRDPETGPLLKRISRDLAERQARGSLEFTATFRSAAALISKISGETHGEMRKARLYDCYRFFYAMGDTRCALAMSVSMRELSEQTKDLDCASVAKNLEGIARTKMGDVGKGLLCYAEGAGGRGANRQRLSTGQRPGQHRDGTQFDRTLPRRHPMPSEMPFVEPSHRKAHASNLAQGYLELGLFEQGLEVIKTAIAHDDGPPDPLTSLSRCVSEFTYAQLALAVENIPLARERSLVCHQYSRFASHRRKWLANVVTGLCDVKSGNEARGIKRLINTLDESEGAPFHAVDSLMALVRAYDEIGQPEQALEYLNRLLLLLQSNRTRSIEGLLAWSVELDDEIPPQLVLEHSRLRAKAAERRTEAITIEILERLAMTADLKEDSSDEHGRRVGTLSRLTAEAIGWKASAASSNLRLAFTTLGRSRFLIPFYDILDLLKSEPAYSCGPTAKRARSCFRTAQRLRCLAETIARCHHEACDGSGYPRGLNRSRIPLGARIVALADAFDAMTNDRSYSLRAAHDDARDRIHREIGGRFDPDIAQTFFRVIEQLRGQFGSVGAALEASSGRSAISGARKRIGKMLKAYADVASGLPDNSVSGAV